jgi:hypothetical protein
LKEELKKDKSTAGNGTTSRDKSKTASDPTSSDTSSGDENTTESLNKEDIKNIKQLIVD